MNKVALKIKNIIADTCFGEIGRPTGIYWSKDRRILAIASSLDWLQWSGRDLNTKLKFHHRVGLYDAATCQLIGVFDKLKYPVNHIDFHPEESLIAIATGAYDGGYCFEGELLLWDFKNDRSYKPLRENREVTTCQFSRDGRQLYFVLRPPCEEDEEGNSLEETFYTYASQQYFESLFLESIKEITMREAGISEAYTIQNEAHITEILSQLALENALAYEKRWHVWDVCMLKDNAILATSAINYLEHWSVDGRLQSAIPAQEKARAVEILELPETDAYLINVEQRSINPIQSNTVGYQWHMKTHELKEWIKRDYPISVSANKDLDLLAREVFRFPKDKNKTLDFIIHADGSLSSDLNLGHYDLINHYLRIKDAPHLYFIQGTPASSHEQKWICQLTAANQQYERLFPLEWDTKRKAHMFSDGGCYCEDSQGQALILAVRFYAPNPSALPKDHALVMRRKLPHGEVLWKQGFDSQITSILWIEEHNLILLALTQGKLCILSADEGQLLSVEEVKIHGVQSVIMSMSYHHNNLVAGTIDGRIICYELTWN